MGGYTDARCQDRYHPDDSREAEFNLYAQELPSSYWNNFAQAALNTRLGMKLNFNVAKNVILSIGDGMSVPTLTVARTYLGQLRGRTGEEEKMSFEKFPCAGLVKTYCVNAQIPDSTCTATAYLCGIKNNRGTACVSAEVNRGECEKQPIKEYQVDSIAAWALKAGKEAGIVTNTRVTHASPSGSVRAERNWENNAVVENSGHDIRVCRDIAHQLVTDFPGKDFKVIPGGGRNQFITTTTVDEQGTTGLRTDGRNLIEEWKVEKNLRKASFNYVWNREQLLNLDIDNTDYLMGLFNRDHLEYALRDSEHSEPRLEELTETAIKMLSKNEDGFFLFVEGGRIDHAHHDNQAHLAVDETVEFHKAVQKALDMTSVEDTHIVVSSDHAHVMGINGYALRGSDVLGLSDSMGDDGMPYTTLSYTNGPGFRRHQSPGIRTDISEFDYKDIDFQYSVEVPLYSETHGGDDVAVFASGPFEHLFSGLFEQSEIPHRMVYAACIGTGADACTSTGNIINSLGFISLFVIFFMGKFIFI